MEEYGVRARSVWNRLRFVGCARYTASDGGLQLVGARAVAADGVHGGARPDGALADQPQWPTGSGAVHCCCSRKTESAGIGCCWTWDHYYCRCCSSCRHAYSACCCCYPAVACCCAGCDAVVEVAREAENDRCCCSWTAGVAVRAVVTVTEVAFVAGAAGTVAMSASDWD